MRHSVSCGDRVHKGLLLKGSTQCPRVLRNLADITDIGTARGGVPPPVVCQRESPEPPPVMKSQVSMVNSPSFAAPAEPYVASAGSLSVSTPTHMS